MIKHLQILAKYVRFNIETSAKSEVTCFLLDQVKGKSIFYIIIYTFVVHELLSKQVDNSISFKLTPTSHM